MNIHPTIHSIDLSNEEHLGRRDTPTQGGSS